MKIIFWGTRGAISAPKPDQIVFGVHTTCIEIRNENDSLLFDAGFGIGRYSDSLPNKSGIYHLFFTHFHWDHVQGIGYFIPIFLPSTHLYIYSPWTIERLKKQLNYYFDYSFGPFSSIEDKNLSSHISYNSLTGPVEMNGFTIGFFENTHEGNCYGYWIACQEKKIALITDHEACAMNSYETWGTDYNVVIHDAQYTDEEYQQFYRGRGHSSFSLAIENSQKMGAHTIILTHHEPLRTDAELLLIEADLRQKYPDVNIILAREQVVYEI